MSEFTIEHTWKVGPYHVTGTAYRADSGQLLVEMEWEPYLPERLEGQMLRAYRRGRDHLLALAATAAGIAGVGIVLELPAEVAGHELH